MPRRVNYSGLVIAGIGFFLTRFTVTLAIYEEPFRFYLAGVVPLTLGLGLAAFGVALAVADVEAALVRTTALWCVIGAGTMLVLVALTLLGSATEPVPGIETIRAQTYLSNFLIGGSVGGTLTGLYAHRNRRQRRELQQQANRLEVLNRLLRHEVLNAVTVIQGYTHLGGKERPDASRIVEDSADAIVETIEEVKYLTRREGGGRTPSVSIDLAASLADSVDTIREDYPDARITVGEVPEGLAVLANERLDRVFTHLLENGVVYAETDRPAVAVDVTATAGAASVAISDEGPGLPASQRALLEEGTIEEFDDPGAGFGLNIVRLLVESYDGRIETAVDGAGTTVTVVLPRGQAAGTGVLPDQSGLAGIRPAVPHLIVTIGAAILAGVVYGIVSEQLGGSVAAIGVFYGFQNPVVGWITHEFHSAVFGFVFSGLVTLAPARYRNHLPAYALIGLAWGFFLWVVAAGVIAPVWLRLLGIAVAVPTFSPELLVSHLAWGVTLGTLTAWGYDRVTPTLARLGRRFVRDQPGGKP